MLSETGPSCRNTNTKVRKKRTHAQAAFSFLTTVIEVSAKDLGVTAVKNDAAWTEDKIYQLRFPDELLNLGCTDESTLNLRQAILAILREITDKWTAQGESGIRLELSSIT